MSTAELCARRAIARRRHETNLAIAARMGCSVEHVYARQAEDAIDQEKWMQTLKNLRWDPKTEDPLQFLQRTNREEQRAKR